ncbi:MAG TPA: isochorismatase family protein [Sphingomonas sp.]|nr:isochorismatase family protein [Sphingomonas sp.]
MRRLIIVVDAQADFMLSDGALPVPGAEEVIAPLNRWLAGLTPEDTAAVLFTFDTHDPVAYAGSAEAEAFPPHCLAGTPGWALVADPATIDPAIAVYRLTKSVFDMWAEADATVALFGGGQPVPRDAFFATLAAAGVGEAVVVGVAADFCVRWAVQGLIERGFSVAIPAALTRGIARDIGQVKDEEWSRAAVVLQ